jgi:hypothetical protein
MAQATEYPTPLKLTAHEVQSLADRLYSRAVSKLATDTRMVRIDMVLASRTRRGLLTAYEHAAGRPLATVIVAAEGC